MWEWNGITWSQISSFSDPPYSPIGPMVCSRGTLYVGTYGNGAWAWNGYSWSQVGEMGGTSGLPWSAAWVNSLASSGDTLYLGTWEEGVWAITLTQPSPIKVTGVSPTSGPPSGGTTVRISGSGFTGATAVNFGSTPATSFTVNSDTLITATSPVGSGTVDVTVCRRSIRHL